MVAARAAPVLGAAHCGSRREGRPSSRHGDQPDWPCGGPGRAATPAALFGVLGCSGSGEGARRDVDAFSYSVTFRQRTRHVAPTTRSSPGCCQYWAGYSATASETAPVELRIAAPRGRYSRSATWLWLPELPTRSSHSPGERTPPLVGALCSGPVCSKDLGGVIEHHSGVAQRLFGVLRRWSRDERQRRLIV